MKREIWSPVSAVRGRCPRPLDDGTRSLFSYQISETNVKAGELHTGLVVDKR
jgi:hypothetical protein